MSLRKYTQQCWMIAEDFQAALSSEDTAALRADLKQIGEDAWHVWVGENRAAISGLLATTPARRAKRRDWKDPLLRRRLALAAHQQARLAALLLYEADELHEGSGYRDMCASAARTAHELLLNMQGALRFWPFDGPAPFRHWAIE